MLDREPPLPTLTGLGGLPSHRPTPDTAAPASGPWSRRARALAAAAGPAAPAAPAAEPLRRRWLLLQQSPVAGFQYHDGERAWPLLREGAELHLAREWANPRDALAVTVWFRVYRLGYLPRAGNATVAGLLDRGERVCAYVVSLREGVSPWQHVRIAVELWV